MFYYEINLMEHDWGYLFVFFLCYGNLYANSRNRGKLTLELNIQDRWIIEQFAALVPFYSSLKVRTRHTNFQKDHCSIVWSVHNRSFREALMSRGFPEGKKSDKITVPD